MSFLHFERDNPKLNDVIESYIEQWDGTATGQDIRNMYENGSSYEAICERMGLDFEDFA